MWFIIWQGHGYLAVLIPVINILLFSLFKSVLSESLFNIGLFICTGVSSYLLWIIGKRLNRRRRLIDPKTNKEVILKHYHSLFFVKLEYYGLMLGVFSVLGFIYELIVYE